MSWWPFKRKSKPFQEDPHIRGTQVWLQDLREVCERNFDNPTEGQRMVRELQVEWTAAIIKSLPSPTRGDHMQAIQIRRDAAQY